MDLSVISLIVLIAVILVAYKAKINIGILALAVAIILARIGGISDKDMYSSINLNVFWTLVGINFFGQCMTKSETLSLLAKKIMAKVPVKANIWPIFSFIFTMLFAMLGPTTLLSLTLVPLITIEIAGFIGANQECTMILTMLGGIAGRMTPLGGNLAGQLALAEGYGFTEKAEMTPIFFWNHVLVCTILAIIYYFVFKGYVRTDASTSDKDAIKKVEVLQNIPPFSDKQKICLACFVGYILFYAIFQWHIGFVGIIMSVIMILTGCVSQKDVIDRSKWSTVIMVCGSGILASVVQSLGGITILANIIGLIPNITVLTGVYSTISGILSMFTHAMSVPIPILFSTVEETITNLGGTRLDMFRCLAAIGSGAYIGMTCPMSLAGANVFSCWTSVVNPDEKTQQKEFSKMILFAAVSSILAGVISSMTLKLFS